MLAVVIAEALAIVLLGLLVVGLLRSHADILRALHELGAGLEDDDRAASAPRPRREPEQHGGTAQAAHDVSGLQVDGSAASVAVVGARHETVLAFLSTTCVSCEPFWDTFAGPVELPGDARLVVVVQEGDSVKRLRRLAGPELLVVRSDAAWEDYAVPGSPHFVHADGASGQVLGEGTADTWDQVLDLLGHAATGLRPREDPRDNAERIDRELLASGIGPGHPSLYPGFDDTGSEARP